MIGLKDTLDTLKDYGLITGDETVSHCTALSVLRDRYHPASSLSCVHGNSSTFWVIVRHLQAEFTPVVTKPGPLIYGGDVMW